MQKLARAVIGTNNVDDCSRYCQSPKDFTMEFAEKTCDILAATLKQVAEMIAAADGVAICWAMGVTQHGNGSDASTAISNCTPEIGRAHV